MSRERTHKGRREDILRAALGLFGDKGIHDTRIEEVAVAAGIGKGTIYEYFRSKEELIAAAILYEMEALTDMVRHSMEQQDTVRDKLKAIVETVALHRRQHHLTGMLDINPASIGSSMKDLKDLFLEQNAIWRSWLEEMVANGVSSGEIRHIDAQLFLGALKGAILELIHPWNSQICEEISPAETAELVIDFFFNGIGHHACNDSLKTARLR